MNDGADTVNKINAIFLKYSHYTDSHLISSDLISSEMSTL